MKRTKLAIVSAVALLIVGGSFVLLKPAKAQEQPPPDVFLPVDASGWVDPLLPDDAILRSRPVAVDQNTLALVTPPDPHAAVPTIPIRFNLFEDISVTVVFHKAKPRYDIQIPDNPFDLLGQEFEPVGYTWSGNIVGEHQGHAIMVTDVGVCAVNISVSGVGRFRVRRSGDLHAVREIGGSSTWECGMVDDGSTVQSLGAGGPGAGIPQDCDDGSTIDLIVFYTEAARLAAGGTANIEMEIDMAVEYINTVIYPTSVIDTTLRLLSKVELDYAETFSLDDVCRLAFPWDGFMDEVHPLRDGLRADVVSLIMSTGGSAGYKMLQQTPSFEYASVNVVQRRQGNHALDILLAHELGHNMGCAHDRTTDGCFGCPDCGNCDPACVGGLFPYSFGYRFSLGGPLYRTIMAGGGTFEFIDQYSNPNGIFCIRGDICGGTGVPAGPPDCTSADNALTINTTRTTVANFRESCDTTDTTSMASFDYSNGQGNGLSKSVSISDNGQYLAFASDATNLGPSDGNAVTDVFVYNRESGVVSAVSLNTDTQTMGNGASLSPAVSGDRHFVALATDATNLITGATDDNLATDIYVFDLFEPPHSSCDPAGGVRMVRVSVSTNPLEPDPNNDSFAPAISFTGNLVAFASDATNLVGNDTLGHRDIFLRDTELAQTSRVSVSTAEAEANGPSFNPAISASPDPNVDGRFVTFESDADNLVAGDTPPAQGGHRDIFVRDTDLVSPETFRISVSTAGDEADGDSFSSSISGDGQFVVFESDATNLIEGDTLGHRDIFIRNLLAQPVPVTFRISDPAGPTEANGASRAPAISTDGRFVVFESDATNLVTGGVDTNGQSDVFVYEMSSGTIARASINSSSQEATGGGSFAPVISRTGRFVAFESDATNLVPDDQGGFRDIFFRDRGTSCVGDFNDDGVVDAADLAILLGAWGPVSSCPPYIAPDLDQDCNVGPIDLAILLGAWGPCP